MVKKKVNEEEKQAAKAAKLQNIAEKQFAKAAAAATAAADASDKVHGVATVMYSSAFRCRLAWYVLTICT